MCAPKGAKFEGSGNEPKEFIALLNKVEPQLGGATPMVVAPLQNENEG
jgi:hypothetical protein